MATKTDSSPYTEVECFEDGCHNKIPVAIWEDNVLSGKYVPICPDCDEDRPEFNLWDAEAIENNSPPYGDEIDSHPIPDGKEYVVVDKHRNWQEEVDEMFDGGIPKTVTKPEDPCLEIFIRDPESTELLLEARREAQEILDN